MSKTCRSCGAVFVAGTCPACGRSGGLQSSAKLILLAIVVVALVALIAVSPRADPPQNPFTVIRHGKNALEANLRDPSSVEYGDVWVGKLADKGRSALVACGYYNARNGFGGRNGQRRFIGGPSENVAVTDETFGRDVMNTMWEQACVDNRQPFK